MGAGQETFMTATVIKSFSKVMNPVWVTGPIFDKELRVSSRRKRNYWLRFAYLAVLTVFVVMVWLSVVQVQGAFSVAYQVSRMSMAGIQITSAIVGFQFLATQLIAVIMLSTSISDEIYNRTLGLLMTTPINSFQIVMGKLFSKLLQLVLLLAISLPLLAIVRVFGGVPWGFVISSLCITLTAVIFAGSLSLYFSISGRRAYSIILKTLFTLGILYLFIPAMAGLLFRSWLFDPMSRRLVFAALTLPNPLAAMQVNIGMMFSPTGRGGLPFFSWPLHCGVMLGASALLLAWSVKVVRKVALRQATGQLDPIARRKRRRKQGRPSGGTAESQELSGRIRPVIGSPVVWKELRTPLIQGGKTKSMIGLVLTIIALFVTYGVNMMEDVLDEGFAHVLYTLVFVAMGLITNAVLSATTITSEKEARSWPILLATSLDDWEILMGKAVGVFRRCLPIWIFLTGHLLLFVWVGYIHPIAVVHSAMLVAWIVVFLSGSGLYFSARLKHTTSAVVANFALALALWVVIPMLLGLATAVSHDDDTLWAYMSTHPMVQTVVIMNAAGGSHNASSNLSRLDYDWPHDYDEDSWLDWDRAGGTSTFLLLNMLVYMSFGFLFAWRAKARFRRNIF
jgi:ABC-type transport system involved in multi-copper enzyme maturation permease subunit